MIKDDDENKNTNKERLRAQLAGLKNNPAKKSADILSMIRNRDPSTAREYMDRLRNGEFNPKDYDFDYRHHPFYQMGLRDGDRMAEDRFEEYLDEMFEHLQGTVNLLRKR